jgi:hypothetical protein
MVGDIVPGTAQEDVLAGDRVVPNFGAGITQRALFLAQLQQRTLP